MQSASLNFAHSANAIRTFTSCMSWYLTSEHQYIICTVGHPHTRRKVVFPCVSLHTF